DVSFHTFYLFLSLPSSLAELYTLSLHDALPISWDEAKDRFADRCFAILNEYAPNFKRSVIDRQVLSPLDLERRFGLTGGNIFQGDRKSTRLNSSHVSISYAVFCLKKKSH